MSSPELPTIEKVELSPRELKIRHLQTFLAISLFTVFAAAGGIRVSDGGDRNEKDALEQSKEMATETDMQTLDKPVINAEDKDASNSPGLPVEDRHRAIEDSLNLSMPLIK